MLGISFNGKHSFKDFGLLMRSKNRPILPEPKIVIEEVLGRDGEYDFSTVNPDGRIKNKSREMQIEFGLKEKDPKILRIKAHEIAMWLRCGEQQLIFDDETAVFYLAQVVNKIDLENVITIIKTFTVKFRCRPYAFSQVKSNELLEFGQDLTLGYGYRLDMQPTVFEITEPTILDIYNPGTYVKPVIKIEGSCSNISFTINGKTLTYNSSLSEALLEIDCEKMKAIKDTNINANNDTYGSFLELGNGDNALSIGGDNLNCTVTLIFNYLYL